MKRLIKAENEFIYKLANGANYKIECSEEPYPIEEGLKVDSYFEFLDELVEAVKYDGGDLNFVEYFNRYDENIPEGSLKSITVEFDPSSYKLITTVVANQSLNDAALDKIKDITELIDAMEDKRLEELCNFIKQDEKSQNN